MKVYRFYRARMINMRVFLLSLLVTPILAVVGPESLGSDISILLHNDLLGEYEPR